MKTEKLSAEDKALFQDAMRDVAPLKKGVDKITVTTDKNRAEPLRKPKGRSENTLPDVALSDFISEPVDSETILSWMRNPLPGKRFKALKQGELLCEARLDLHGMTVEEARIRLVSFIRTQFALNKRCLHLIHGKGGYGQSAPLLKNLTQQWLKQLPEVLAFHSALPKDGGSGALYVLLKRQSLK